MQTTYIARQAIFDRNANAIGYELLFRNSPENKFPELDLNVATSKLIIQNHIHGDITALCMGKLAFINFTEHCLINKYPLLFDTKDIVIELVGSNKPTSRFIKILKYYFEKGYKIALTEYDLEDHWDVIFPYLYLVKVDVEKINAKRLSPVVKKLKPFDVKLTAEKVETRFQLQSLAEVGFSAYQGFFYHEPEVIEGQTLAPIKTQMLHLISETFNVPFNFDAIAKVISQDVNLSVSLLKLVNNVAVGTQVEITSLKQAAAYLGEDKLKQFVTILALSKLTVDQTDEIAKQALITGKLMAAIAKVNAFKEIKDLAFITGLLSAIEVLLSMPMDKIVQTMPLAKPIETALVNHEGLLGELLDFTTNYITGRNDKVEQTLENFSLDQDFIHKEFVSASKWCNALDI
ncbi:EAL and HDOD domain-containing protein [Thalassotalea sp. PLHSN55]|uniref:EAL and HDOD domain-containing protein n=1 Tax=Thalassotalea sp. PLHSN55 TaxID=3435888 RepID=UPI003F841957